jgi:hypothetical protein
MKEILAKTAIYTSNTGQYKDPIDIFNPLEFVGDPRDKNYLFRQNVRRDFFDMWDNSKKAPTYLALY